MSPVPEKSRSGAEGGDFANKKLPFDATRPPAPREQRVSLNVECASRRRHTND